MKIYKLINNENEILEYGTFEKILNQYYFINANKDYGFYKIIEIEF